MKPVSQRAAKAAERIAEAVGVTMETVRAGSITSSAKRARHLAVVYLRDVLNLSYPEIAAVTSARARNHSGVWNAYHSYTEGERAVMVEQCREYTHEPLPGYSDTDRSPAHVIAVVADHFGFQAEAMRSHERGKAVSYARHLAIVLVRRLNPQLSVSDIGRAFNRDHTTIVAACRRADIRCSVDWDILASRFGLARLKELEQRIEARREYKPDPLAKYNTSDGWLP